jgi:hypothetical protein
MDYSNFENLPDVYGNVKDIQKNIESIIVLYNQKCDTIKKLEKKISELEMYIEEFKPAQLMQNYEKKLKEKQNTIEVLEKRINYFQKHKITDSSKSCNDVTLSSFSSDSSCATNEKSTEANTQTPSPAINTQEVILNESPIIKTDEPIKKTDESIKKTDVPFKKTDAPIKKPRNSKSKKNTNELIEKENGNDKNDTNNLDVPVDNEINETTKRKPTNRKRKDTAAEEDIKTNKNSKNKIERLPAKKIFDNTPVEEQVFDTIMETVSEPVIEPVSEPVIKPVSEPVFEPVFEPVIKPVSEPVFEPVIESVVVPVIESVVVPVIESVVVPVIEPVVVPVIEPVSEPVIEPVSEPVIEPVSEPVIEPVSQTVIEPVSQTVIEPVSEPVVKTSTNDKSNMKASESKFNTGLTKGGNAVKSNNLECGTGKSKTVSSAVSSSQSSKTITKPEPYKQVNILQQGERINTLEYDIVCLKTQSGKLVEYYMNKSDKIVYKKLSEGMIGKKLGHISEYGKEDSNGHIVLNN